MDIKLLEEFNKYFQEAFNISDPLEFDPELNIARCYGFVIGLYDVETATAPVRYWISFNDEITTSHLIQVAMQIVPALQEIFAAEIDVIDCFMPMYNDEGNTIGIQNEQNYDKLLKCKELPESPPEKPPTKRKTKKK